MGAWVSPCYHVWDDTGIYGWPGRKKYYEDSSPLFATSFPQNLTGLVGILWQKIAPSRLLKVPVFEGIHQVQRGIGRLRFAIFPRTTCEHDVDFRLEISFPVYQQMGGSVHSYQLPTQDAVFSESALHERKEGWEDWGSLQVSVAEMGQEAWDHQSIPG